MRDARLVLLALLAAFGPAPAYAVDAGSTLNHVVYCNGYPVGSSVIRFVHEGDELVVESSAAIKVEIGPLTLFAYQFTSREVWRGDTLVSLDTKTDDNGRHMAVTGRAAADGFHVQGVDGAAIVDPQIRPRPQSTEDGCFVTHLAVGDQQ